MAAEIQHDDYSAPVTVVTRLSRFRNRKVIHCMMGLEPAAQHRGQTPPQFSKVAPFPRPFVLPVVGTVPDQIVTQG